MTDSAMALIPGDELTAVRVDRGITLLAEIDMSLVSGIKALSWIFGKQTWQASISFWPGAAGGSWNIGFGGAKRFSSKQKPFKSLAFKISFAYISPLMKMIDVASGLKGEGWLQ